MFVSGLKAGCGCQMINLAHRSQRLLHQTVFRFSVAAEQSESVTDENVCWVRKRSSELRYISLAVCSEYFVVVAIFE